MVYLFVGIAGALGAILRYLFGLLLFTNSLFPYTTLSINLIGSFLLAWLTTGLFQKTSLPASIKAAIGTGFVGSFTTFSIVTVESLELFQNGNAWLGVLYVLGSLFGGLFMSGLGFNLGNREGKKS